VARERRLGGIFTQRRSRTEGVAEAEPGGPRSSLAIRQWLATEVANRVGLPIDRIDYDAPLTSYGLDSRTAISLTGDLEEWLGLELSPTLVWDYPSIAQLSDHLEACSAAARAGSS
jgi:acyl carrier protein